MQTRDLIESDLRSALALLAPRHRRETLTKNARELRDKARKACRRWLVSPNVIGFGVGPRLSNGKPTGDLALRVLVRKKKSKQRLRENLIPPAVRLPGLSRAILIDVIEGEIPNAHAAMPGDGFKLSGSRFSGTIGCVMGRNGSSDLFAVTCRHVLDGEKRDTVEWTEFPPDATPPNPVIGQLAFFSNAFQAGDNFPNTTDIALVRLLPGALDEEIRNLGRITGIRMTPLNRDERVRICGLGKSEKDPNNIGVSEGFVQETGAFRLLNYRNHGVLGYRDLGVCTRFTEERDSGAAVIDDQNQLVGIHMAGTSEAANNAESIFQPISAVITEFGLFLPDGDDATVARGLVSGSPGGGTFPLVGNLAEAIDILARTLWGEARGESDAGRGGVASVILNRVARNRPGRFGGTVEAVCQMPFQFSCWNVNDPNRGKLLAVTDSNKAFRQCLELARLAVKGEVADNTFGSDHYHAQGTVAKWAKGKTPVVTIGKHLFYNDIP